MEYRRRVVDDGIDPGYLLKDSQPDPDYEGGTDPGLQKLRVARARLLSFLAPGLLDFLYLAIYLGLISIQHPPQHAASLLRLTMLVELA